MTTWTPERIKALRAALGDSQHQFANRIGTTPTTVARWETGKSQPMQIFVRALEKLQARI